jgi:broad specificity phosphatase PhoE
MGGTPVRILLARHGETVSNVSRRWQGQADSPLTQRGLAQARELARALADEPIAAVYSSDLGRAMQTAEEVAAVHGLSVQGDARLRELDTGGWTGKTRDEIELEFPGGLRSWAETPARVRLPGGESILEAQTRALAFFPDRMPAHRDQTVVIISHGALGQTILVNAMGGSIEDLWLEHFIDNCQISRLDWTPYQGLHLVELADVRHLESVGSLRGRRMTDSA